MSTALLRALGERLRASGSDWPAPLHHHERLASTNDRLKELARAGAPLWTAVLADEQTAGRGRQGHLWFSPRGNLHLSVLLPPPPGPAGLVTLVAGVAVQRALASFGAPARLKWPNDLVVGEGKLAGLLAETSAGAEGVEWVVLGVGVNVDPRPAAGAAAPPAGAISLREATGRAPSLDAVAAAILREIALEAARADPREALRAWRLASVPWWGQRVRAHEGERVVEGVAKDVADDGALLVVDDAGRELRVVAGQVERVRLARGSAGG